MLKYKTRIIARFILIRRNCCLMNGAASFGKVEELAPGRSPRELADLFIDYKLALNMDRDAAISLSSSVAGILERRKPLGDAMRGRIASILRAGNAALSEGEAAAAAVIISQVMKIVPALAAMKDEGPPPLIGEARKLLALYIGGIMDA